MRSRGLSAHEVLDRLREGNLAWAARVTSLRSLASQEAPRLAVVVTCSDQWDLPEDAFQVGMGELLVAQTPGPFVDDSVAATISFGLHVLDIRLVVVLVHEKCAIFEPAHLLPTTALERQVMRATRAAAEVGERVAGHHARAQVAAVHQRMDLEADVIVVPAVLSRSRRVEWL